MKKIKIILGCLTGMLFLVSCNDFLTLKPRDEKVVKTVEDYRDILASYVHHIKTPNRPQKVVMGVGSYTVPKFDVAYNFCVYSGEQNMNKKSAAVYDSKKDEYTPSAKSLMSWRNTESYVWDQYYEFLGPINLIIDGIRTAESSNEDIQNYVLGEALVWRAFAYFKLLQYYAPYKDNKYGIPVYLKPYDDIGNAMPGRKTQKEVYEQILGDCKEALQLMEITASNPWNCAWRNDFLNAMMASIYTWKAGSAAAENTDWGNAEQHATEAMRNRSLSNSPDVLRQMFDCSSLMVEVPMESDEFYFRIMDGYWGQICNLYDTYYGSSLDQLVVPQYYNKFRESDIRKQVYFTRDGMYSDKYNLKGSYSGGCIILFRLAEMYLIKAEALVRQGNAGEAKKVLEEFDRARYTEEIAIPSNPDALLQEILDERMREFYQENDFRWMDMKRLGIRVTRQVGGETYVLEPDDFRYSLPIPKRELELNKNMEQTPGWEKIMIN